VQKQDKTTPSSNFLKLISNPDIFQSDVSIIMQLRISHVLLNSYLKWFKIVDSIRCPACSADYKNITHFLLLCPSYAYERWALIKQAQKHWKTLTLETILSTQDMAPHIARYIRSTPQFSKKGKQTSS
jgi:hypothetical protein